MSSATLTCLCFYILATSPSVCEGARIFWGDRAGSASATEPKSKTSDVKLVAHKQRAEIEEQIKHKPVNNKRRPPPAFALERPHPHVQQVGKATTHYKGMAGKEMEGATETDSSSNTTTTEGDGINTVGKYKVGDMVEYKFGEGDADWVDAQIQKIYDSGLMVIEKDFSDCGGSRGREGGCGHESILLSAMEWPLRVIHKLPTPTDMIDKLTVSFVSADASLSRMAVKGIAMQFVAAVTRQFSQFVDCTRFTRITKQQWAEYSKKDVASKEVDDIFHGAREISFTKFLENTLETHLRT